MKNKFFKISLFIFSLILIVPVFLNLLFFQKISSQAQTTPSKPGAVSNIVFSDITTSSLKISWDPATNTDYYKIQRNYIPNIASTTKTFYIDKNLLPCTKYMYVIESVNAYYGNENQYISRGTYSKTASTTTQCLDYYDFHFSFDGPQNVVRGYNLYLRAVVYIFYPENPNNIYFKVINELPPGVSVSFPDLKTKYCNDPDLGCEWWRPSGKAVTTIKITTASTTPLGTFIVRIQAKARSFTREPPDVAVHYVDIPINVLPQPSPLLKKDYDPLPPLPEKSRWETNMVKYGSVNCLPEKLYRWNCCGWEGGVWYYDGMRVYYNIADYTRDDKWIQCGSKFKILPTASYTPYREVVLKKNGMIWGWRVFTEGLTRDYLRFNDELSRQAVILMSMNSSFSNVFQGQRIWDIISPIRQREVAYAILAHLDAEKLGNPEHPNLKDYIDVSLGHFDQLFNFEKFPNSQYSYPYPYIQPFYVALASEALIRYYEEKYPDPRIPVAIKQAYDWMWEYMRGNVKTGVTFSYSDKKDPIEGGGPNLSDGLVDLNLLILPPYGWLYQLTGDGEYIRRGDLLWSAGVKGAWLDNGKQFSQNYRWSFKYLEWRDGYKLTPYIPLTSSFLPDYRQHLKISLFADKYNPLPGDIITYRAVLKNISTTTLIRTKFYFPLATDQDYILDSAYLKISTTKHYTISYRSHKLIITLPYLQPQQEATLIWKMRKK